MRRKHALTAAVVLLTALPAAAAPGKLPPSNTSPPAISGDTTAGQTLTANTGSWDGNGLRFAFQWQRCSSSGVACAAVGGATVSTYTTGDADVGSTMRVSVTATNSRGSTTAVSAASGVVAPPPASPGGGGTTSYPANLSVPTISGYTTPGQVLSASQGSWSGSPTSYGYQWFYCDYTATTCTPIAGATTSTYTPVIYDVGGRDRVRVTATNAGGSTTADSAPTALITSTAISPTSVPAATVGSAYSATLSVSGPAGPYTVAVTSGVLPAGLSLSSSGTLAGTPAAGGTYSFTVTAYTGLNTAATTQSYSLSVSTTTITSNLLFLGDPSAGNLSPWDNFDLGTGTVPVTSSLNGGTSPGVVRATGSRYELTVTPTAHASPAASTDSVYLWNQQKSYLGHNGQDTWEHYTVTFPSASFHPNASCGGGCPWFAEHHNDDGYLSFYNAGQITWEYAEVTFGIITDHTVADGTVKPQIFMRAWGGQDNTPANPNLSPPEYVFTKQALQYDHTYDFRVHITWSPSGTVGNLEWWLDGQLMYSKHRPTLWQRPDGTTDVPNFEFVNYRPHDTVNSTIYFGPVKIGPTSTSVG